MRKRLTWLLCLYVLAAFLSPVSHCHGSEDVQSRGAAVPNSCFTKAFHPLLLDCHRGEGGSEAGSGIPEGSEHHHHIQFLSDNTVAFAHYAHAPSGAGSRVADAITLTDLRDPRFHPYVTVKPDEQRLGLANGFLTAHSGLSPPHA